MSIVVEWDINPRTGVLSNASVWPRIYNGQLFDFKSVDDRLYYGIDWDASQEFDGIEVGEILSDRSLRKQMQVSSQLGVKPTRFDVNGNKLCLAGSQAAQGFITCKAQVYLPLTQK
jgi:hypothetical protein